MERATFFDRLRQGRLLNESELRQTAGRFRDDTPSQIIADALVQDGLLTPFQVRQMADGDTQLLSLGQYRLLDEIGRGGMGRVYKALHTLMGRIVALKILSPERVSDPVAVEWFCREVRASTQLNHANIVMAYDANEADGLHFLVMEFVHGITLDALVKQCGPLPLEHACALIRQTALGLQHAHDRHMVHRDIKPSNLLLPYAESEQPPDVLVKILDFGLARLHGKRQTDTLAMPGASGVLGTPDYIAPEQSRDFHAADIRSDLYSLGCTFYFALTGRVPFPGDNAMEKLIKHLLDLPEPLENLRPDVPADVAALVRRLMAKDPADRYQTPAEVVQALDGWAKDRPRLLPDTSQANRPLWTSPRIQTPSDQPVTDLEPQFTRVLPSVEVFAPTQREQALSGPSLLEPVWKFSPQDSCKPQTHDTLNFSQAEPSAEPRAEPLPMTELPSTTAPREEDATQKDLPTPSSAASPTRPPIDPVVARLWRRWLEFLRPLIERGARANAENYRTIHSLLLRACRAARDSAPVSARRAFYEECLSIAQPWFKLESFTLAERAILKSLLERCQAIDQHMNGGKLLRTIHQCIGLVLLVLSPLAAALWYWDYGRVWLPRLLHSFEGELTLASLHSAWKFLRLHPALLMGVVFPLVALFALSLLSRTPRR